MTNKEIGEHVAAFMAERGWDDKQMAKHCNALPCQIRDAIAGKSRVKSVLTRIARKLDLKVPGLTVEGRRQQAPRKMKPNRMRDLVMANGYTWHDLADELGLEGTQDLFDVGEGKPIRPRMLEAFEEFTGLTHQELLKLSLKLCRTDRQLQVYNGQYAACYGCYPDGTPFVDRRKRGEEERFRIPATIAGIEQEMDRLNDEAPADETPEQRAERIEHLDALWRARRDLRAKSMEDAV